MKYITSSTIPDCFKYTQLLFQVKTLNNFYVNYLFYAVGLFFVSINIPCNPIDNIGCKTCLT